MHAKEQMQSVSDLRWPRPYCIRKQMRIQRILIKNVTFALVVVLSTLQGGCGSPKTPESPTIEFTKIPPAAQGGRERVDIISGRVTGVRPGQRVVVYARSGPWWVQPWPDKPFIPIQADSTWSTETHLGFEYAAMVVEPTYHPPPTMDIAPTKGGSIVAVKTEIREG